MLLAVSSQTMTIKLFIYFYRPFNIVLFEIRYVIFLAISYHCDCTMMQVIFSLNGCKRVYITFNQ